MIKAKQAFFWTSDPNDYGCHGNILSLTSKYHLLSVLSVKLCFFLNQSCTSKVMVIEMYDAENF